MSTRSVFYPWSIAVLPAGTIEYCDRAGADRIFGKMQKSQNPIVCDGTYWVRPAGGRTDLVLWERFKKTRRFLSFLLNFFKQRNLSRAAAFWSTCQTWKSLNLNDKDAKEKCLWLGGTNLQTRQPLRYVRDHPYFFLLDVFRERILFFRPSTNPHFSNPQIHSDDLQHFYNAGSLASLYFLIYFQLGFQEVLLFPNWTELN